MKIKIYLLCLIAFCLLVSCFNKPDAVNKSGETHSSDTDVLEQPVFLVDLSVPIPELSEDEKNLGVFYDNKMEGGWQLLDMDGKPTTFAVCDAFLFVAHCDPKIYKDMEDIKNITGDPYYAVLYYKTEKSGVWKVEYSYGVRKGSLIEIAPQNKNSKGSPYIIRHVIDTDGKRYLTVEGHPYKLLGSRKFVKTLP